MQFETTTELVLVFVAGIGILLLLIGYIVYFLFVYQRKQQENIAANRNREIKFQEQLLQSQLEIQEQTLQHIAHEVHDNLGQIASLVKINLNTLQLNGSEASVQKLEDTKDLVRQLITDLKSMSMSLSSNRVVQLGIVKTLAAEVERLTKTGQYQANMALEGDIPTIDDNTTIILYRMMQEIMNNIVKHSGASRVDIMLKQEGNLFILACSDNGVGFKYEEGVNSGGSGLLNLRSRARLINCSLAIESTTGVGTTVTIELPIR